MATQTTKDSISLLLVGKTGVGKSSTGNTIVGTKKFKTGASQSVVTQECMAEYSHVLGRKVKVVDIPGLGDAALDEADDLQKVIEEVMTAVAETPDGYDAILIVIQYGRQSKEDQQIVTKLKKILGDNFIAEFGILLITHGDQFDPVENDNQTLEEWCSSKESIVKNLRKECHGRVILFHNKSKDSKVQNRQLKHLLSIVDEMKSGKRYLPKHFDNAQAERQKLLVESQEQRILENIREPTRLIMNDLDCISVEEDPEKAIPRLQDLYRQIKELRRKVASQDNGTEVLNNVLDMINTLDQAVNDKLQLAGSIQTKRKLQNQLVNMKAKKSEERLKLLQQLEDKNLQMQEVEQKQKREREEAERKYQVMEEQNKARREKIKAVLVVSAVGIGISALAVGTAAIVTIPRLLPAAGQVLRAAVPAAGQMLRKAAPKIIKTVAAGAATTAAAIGVEMITEKTKKEKEKEKEKAICGEETIHQ